jgi:DNA polymerase III gamma/tau subunit
LQLIAEKENITLTPAAAHAIARGAEGGMRDAESMLDQLVAFCGENVTEEDVLNVFGFTSEHIVADFVSRILRGETPGALGLLHEQCDAGKDMMKLMSDTMAYLRDLLVFKVKPDALADDISDEIRQSFASQASLIETNRVLELIDQFAAAEGRMKWAPNKKLHFEVAVIKAIQTLTQATLDDVIENLSALRDGNPIEAKPAGKESARTENKTAKQIAQPIEEAAKESADTGRLTLDLEKTWDEVISRIPKHKGFLHNLAASAHFMGIEGRNFVLGFPPEQKSLIETVGTANNRKFLESLMAKVTGKQLSAKLITKEGLPPKDPKAQIENSAKRDRAEAPPIVREALEMFKGEIKETR